MARFQKIIVREAERHQADYEMKRAASTGGGSTHNRENNYWGGERLNWADPERVGELIRVELILEEVGAGAALQN